MGKTWCNRVSNGHVGEAGASETGKCGGNPVEQLISMLRTIASLPRQAAFGTTLTVHHFGHLVRSDVIKAVRCGAVHVCPPTSSYTTSKHRIYHVLKDMPKKVRSMINNVC